MAEQFVNEQSGEVTTLEEHLAILRSQEREIGPLDHTIAQLKGDLKMAKEGRERAVSDLRTTVREVKVLSASRRAGKKGKRR